MQSEPQNKFKFLLWVGKSQTGKSSSIKFISGDPSIKCGKYGTGNSTTYQIKVHKDQGEKLSQSYCHIDTIGLGDTRLKYNDKEIRNNIEREIIKMSK